MVINVRKIVILAVILLLILQLAGIHIFYSSAFLPEQEFVDPSYDLVDIYTCVPSEVYVGYLDVIRCSVEWTVEAFDFYVTINGGIPALTYTTFWNVLIDADNNPENNCPDAPYKNVDTMYSLVYDSSKSEWRIERATYETWGWSQKFTDATWGITSSWPEGQPVITISIPIYEMPEMLPETLPWKVLTECTGTYIGDFAPNCGELYSTPILSEFMFIEGVFQPVQVVYQQDPIWGDNMTRINSSEWNASIPMVKGKNTFLFGYPYHNRNTLQFNVSNFYTVQITFTLAFWIRPENKKIWEAGPYTVEPSKTEKINISAPIPCTGYYYSPTPFQFEKTGNSTVEVEVTPASGSTPIVCNKVSVHVNVIETKSLTIIYVPIVLYNGTTGADLHTSVSNPTVHAEKATNFIKGIYPVAEKGITWRVTPTFRINFSEVRASEPLLPSGVNKVNMSRVNEKLVGYAATMYGGLIRVVGLVPDGARNWPETYDYRKDATHWWNATWKGTTFISQRTVVFVVDGWWGTTAHEIGHTFELKKATTGRWEEYNETYRGNNAPGYWVNENKDQDVNVICFMGNVNPYQRFSTWIDKPDYYYLLTKFASSDPEIILVNGLISKNGNVELSSWYRLPSGVPDVSLGTTGDLTLRFLDGSGRMLNQAGFNIQFLALNDEPEEVEVACFAFNVPFVAGTTKIQLLFKGLIVGERIVTANSPAVTISHPNGGEIFNPKSLVAIIWNATDIDGDILNYIVEYSADRGETWVPISVDIHISFYDWNLSGLPAGKNYMVRVLATDGVNVGEGVSDDTFTITFQGDLNEDESVNIHDMFVVAKAFGTSPGHPLWNPKADVDGNGIINIYDLFVVAKNYGKTI